MAKQIKLVGLIKKKSNMGFKEFKEYWIEKHAPIGKTWKNLKKYNINIVAEEIQIKMDEKKHYDNTVDMYWDSYAEMMEDLNSEEGKTGFKDAEVFIEEVKGLYTEGHIVIK